MFSDEDTLFLLIEESEDDSDGPAFQIQRIVFSENAASLVKLSKDAFPSSPRMLAPDSESVFLWYPDQTSLHLLLFGERPQKFQFASNIELNELSVGKVDDTDFRSIPSFR